LEEVGIGLDAEERTVAARTIGCESENESESGRGSESGMGGMDEGGEVGAGAAVALGEEEEEEQRRKGGAVMEEERPMHEDRWPCGVEGEGYGKQRLDGS